MDSKLGSDKFFFRAHLDPAVSFDISLFGYSQDYTKRIVDIVVEHRDPSDCSVRMASLLLGRENAQVLMDDLWRCGVRPTDGAGTAGSMRAVERHLEDMRALVAHYTKAKL